MIARRGVDATGRSTGPVRYGMAKRWKPETPFVFHSLVLRATMGFRSLTAPARRILDFIEREHMIHGGVENGRLVAPYAQLVRFGVSSRDISGGFAMLEAFGIIRRTKVGARQGGKDGASLYSLTWYPVDGHLPTEEFKKVTDDQVRAHLDEGARLRKLASQRRKARREV